jgi:hypothetical protein
MLPERIVRRLATCPIRSPQARRGRTNIQAHANKAQLLQHSRSSVTHTLGKGAEAVLGGIAGSLPRRGADDLPLRCAFSIP